MRFAKSWKWLLITLGVVVVLFLALPSILGRRFVYQPLIDRLAAERFQLTIDQVELGWFRPISFNNIRLKLDEDDDANPSLTSTPLVEIAKLGSDRSLLGFLLAGRDLGTIEVVEPSIDIRLLQDTSNLERLIQALVDHAKESGSQPKESGDNGETKPVKLDATIAIRGLNVTVTDELSQQPIMVVPPFDATITYKSLATEPQIIVEPTQVLNQTVITQELVQLGLARAVPLLAESSRFDGRVSLQTERIAIFIDHPEDSTGQAQLTLHQVRSVPTDPTILAVINLMGRLFKREVPQELVFVDGSQILVEVGDRKVRHAGVRAGLPRVDERLQFATSGTVGMMDRLLELEVEIPVPIEQMARRASVKQLGVPSVTLPIRGTLDDPEVDWRTLRDDSADVLSVISLALSDEAPVLGEAIGVLSEVTEGDNQVVAAGVELARELWQKRQERLQEQRANEAANPELEPEKPRPIRDALRNILRGKEQK